jgi:hypothetical protein
MASVKADVTSHFEHVEDVEVDGYKTGVLRQGVAKIRKGDRVLAELRVGVQIPTDSDDPVKLAILVMPSDDLGYEAEKSLEFSGPVALALIELIKSAAPFLERDDHGNFHWT